MAPRRSEVPAMSIKRESRRTPLTPITSSKMLVTIASVSMCGYHLLSFLCHANSKNGCQRLTIRLARRQFRKIVENCEITRHHITWQLVQKTSTNPNDLLLDVERPHFAALIEKDSRSQDFFLVLMLDQDDLRVVHIRHTIDDAPHFIRVYAIAADFYLVIFPPKVEETAILLINTDITAAIAAYAVQIRHSSLRLRRQVPVAPHYLRTTDVQFARHILLCDSLVFAADEESLHMLERTPDGVKLLPARLKVSDRVRSAAARDFGWTVSIDHFNPCPCPQPSLNCVNIRDICSSQYGLEVRQRGSIEFGSLCNESKHQAPGGKMGHIVSCYRLKQQIREHNVVVDMQTSALGKREQHIHEKNIEMQRRETGANRFPTAVVNFFIPLEKIDNTAIVDQHALGPSSRSGCVDAVRWQVQSPAR